MKHHFAPWTSERPTTGFAKLAIQPGDMHTHCVHCGVTVRMPLGKATNQYWVHGKWTSKRPPCEPPSV